MTSGKDASFGMTNPGVQRVCKPKTGCEELQ
jgi:hypothetical protein